MATGIRKTPTGWRAHVRVRGILHSKSFPPPTGLLVMRRWREAQRVRPTAAHPSATTFAEDVRAYLTQVQTMPTLRDRRDDLDRWILALDGHHRPRAEIASGEIRAQLETWRAAGYAASTVNHRRTALMHLWSVLDGRSALNPARDVPRYATEPQAPRALSQAAVTRLLAAMGPSQTRARLVLMAWTGWPPAQIAKLTPADIRWDDAVCVKPRRKGHGAAGAWLPLLPQAWAALREFKARGCWGRYSTSAARTAFRRAARKARRTLAREVATRALERPIGRRIRAELLDVTPYQLRHTFLSLVAAVTTDDRAVMVLAQHADIRTTHLYTRTTADPRAAAALGLVAAVLDVDAKLPLP